MTDLGPRVAIRYCTRCNWLLRAAWLGQELLSTFGQDLKELALVPADNGEFSITVDDTLLWERKRDHGFPGAAEIKKRLRDKIAPDQALGHTDRLPSVVQHDKRERFE